MPIQSDNDYLASARQNLPFTKTVTRTTVSTGWFSMFDVAGQPGAGTLAGVSTAAGVVPTDATAGYPPINAFGGGATGYLSRVEWASTAASRLTLYDRLWVGGAYAFNALQVLASQPSYSSRVPGGTDFTGTEIWVETVTAATGNQTWNVTYTNQSGTAGRTTGAVGIGAAPTIGRCWQLPLQAGDSGVQKIEQVAGGTGSAGTANIMVLRPLWSNRVVVANFGGIDDMFRVGLPEVWADTAFYMLLSADSTISGVPDMLIEVANK